MALAHYVRLLMDRVVLSVTQVNANNANRVSILPVMQRAKFAELLDANSAHPMDLLAYLARIPSIKQAQLALAAKLWIWAA